METQFTKERGFYRLLEIIGDRKANPPKKGLLPVSRSKFYQGIQRGIYPKPIRLSSRLSLWRISDIHKMLSDIEGNEGN